MLHRVVFLLKIRDAFSVFMVEPCFVDRNLPFTLTVVQRTVLVVKGLGNLGCMKDSAGKFCPDIMPPDVIASVQKKTADVWAEVRVQEPCVAAYDKCALG